MSVDIVLEAGHWEGVDENAQALVDRWLVEEGAHAQAGQPVVRVVLVKSSLEVVAPCAGVVEQVLVAAGENFARGQPLARLRPD